MHLFARAALLFACLAPVRASALDPRRVEHMLLGVAVGDAFGNGFEGMGRDWIAANVDFTRFVVWKPGPFGLGYRLGDYSDDTADTLAVMEALHDPRGFTAEVLLERVRHHYEASRAARGGAPRAGYGSIRRLFSGALTLEQLRERQAQLEYPGNAPPMRALPLGFVDEHDLEPFAVVNADVTHPHRKARAASVVVARAAQWLVRWGRAPSEALAYARGFVRELDAESFAYLGEVDRLGPVLSPRDYERLLGPQPFTSVLDGSAIHGLRPDAMRTAGAALWAVKHATDPFDALKRAIRLGGDVDSVAAIAVGLRAGRDGLDSLPAFLLDTLEDRERLRAAAWRFAAPCAGAMAER